MNTCIVMAVAITLHVGPVAWLAKAAPGPEEKKVAPYHPTRVGARWVYTSGGRDSAEVVMSVKEKGGTQLVTVGYESRGEVTPYRALSISEKGLSVVAYNVADLTEPLWLLKLPHVAGNEWEAVLAGKPWGRAIGTAKAYGPERVVVPAGTYQAIRVEWELPYIDGRKGKNQGTTWYAPAVGKIKEIRGENEELLKSFDPGKE